MGFVGLAQAAHLRALATWLQESWVRRRRLWRWLALWAGCRLWLAGRADREEV